MRSNTLNYHAPAGTAQANGMPNTAFGLGAAPLPNVNVTPPAESAFSFSVTSQQQSAQLAAPIHGALAGLPLSTAYAQRLQHQVALAPLAASPAANTGSMTVSHAQWNALNKQLVDARAQLAYARHERSSSDSLWRQLVSTFKIKREDVLSAAAACGNYSAIIELNSPGVDFNQLDSAGVTPLHSAVRAGRADMVGFLLVDLAIDPNIKSAQGFTPLVYALAARNSEMVRALLADSRVDPNVPFGEPSMPPLTLALVQKDLQSAEWLLASSQLCLDRSAFADKGSTFDQVADMNGLPELAARIRAMVAATNTAALAPVLQVVEPSVQGPAGDDVLDASPALIARSPSFQHLLERIQTPPPLILPDA